LVIIYEKLFLNNLTPGWTFLAIIMLLSLGVTFIAIGLLGEYTGKILMAANKSPQFTIKKKMNVDARVETIISPDYDRKAV
jgi:undecaprenyl-phosphate 4-deoxy-4-formamido-L-arabinose transferase